MFSQLYKSFYHSGFIYLLYYFSDNNVAYNTLDFVFYWHKMVVGGNSMTNETQMIEM